MFELAYEGMAISVMTKIIACATIVSVIWRKYHKQKPISIFYDWIKCEMCVKGWMAGLATALFWMWGAYEMGIEGFLIIWAATWGIAMVLDKYIE